MIDRGAALALSTQARLLGVARSTVYRAPRPVPASDLAIMRRIDALHLDYPFAGNRMMRSMLVNEGVVIGRTHLRTLMRRMGIEALYRRPRTSKPGHGHRIYPYLLRGLAVTRPNQVWAADIRYIPMARGFVYLVVVLDWFSRRALSASPPRRSTAASSPRPMRNPGHEASVNGASSSAEKRRKPPPCLARWMKNESPSRSVAWGGHSLIHPTQWRWKRWRRMAISVKTMLRVQKKILKK